MTVRTTLFRADLFHNKNVGTEDQRRQLIDQIKNKQQLYPQGSLNSNPGCWRWNEPCTDINWLFAEINTMLLSAINLYAEEDKVFSGFKNCQDIEISYWANVNQPGSRNVFHAHKEDHFAVCYYLQASGTGDLRLVNHINILGDCNNTAPFTRDVSISPQDGDLFLWPAWVPHEVETNFSDKERINLVFNIKLK